MEAGLGNSEETGLVLEAPLLIHSDLDSSRIWGRFWSWEPGAGAGAGAGTWVGAGVGVGVGAEAGAGPEVGRGGLLPGW